MALRWALRALFAYAVFPEDAQAAGRSKLLYLKNSKISHLFQRSIEGRILLADPALATILSTVLAVSAIFAGIARVGTDTR